MLSPKSLRDSGDASFIVVELPVEHMKKKFAVDQHTTVAEVLALVQKKVLQLRLPIASVEEYGLVDPISHGNLHSSTLISDTCTTHFLLRRVIRKVNIVYEEENVVRTLSMSPQAAVGDVERDILTMPWGTRFRGCSYSLFLLSANTPAAKRRALRMDNSRTLASYRIKPTDLLYFGVRPSQTRSGILRGASEEERLMLAFIDQETNIQKTMVTSQCDEVRYVLEKLLAKVDPSSQRKKEEYGLFVFNEGVWGLMDPDWQIERFHLPQMCKIRCRKLVKVPVKVFGSDPCLLPMVIDNGLKVPEVLVMIRDRMEELQAFESEGIFRVAGVETEMTELKQCFNAGLPVVSDNCHSMGTMLKRWYKELPLPMFQSVPEEAGEDPELSLEGLTSFMSVTYKNIYLWLLDVLAHTAKFEKKTKMGPKNLAIVWGPGLAVQAENPFASLQTTRWAIEVIERNICYRMENPRVQPPRPVRADVKPPMPSSEQLRLKQLPKPPGKGEDAVTEEPADEEDAVEATPHEAGEGMSGEPVVSPTPLLDLELEEVNVEEAKVEEAKVEEANVEEANVLTLELDDENCCAELQVKEPPPVGKPSAGFEPFAPPPDHPAPPPPTWRAKAGLSPRGDAAKPALEEPCGDEHVLQRWNSALLSPRYDQERPERPPRKKSTPGPGRPPRSPGLQRIAQAGPARPPRSSQRLGASTS